MSGESSQEPPGLVEDNDASPTINIIQDQTDNCQSMSYQEIMMKNKFDLKKREEEVQEYGRKLSKIKSRTKLSRRSADPSTIGHDLSSSSSSKHDLSLPNIRDEDVNDISEAKTPKAKSNLLQKKLAENRKMFEQRSKEMTDSNRAVEEKVEALRQQINETDLLQKDNISIIPVRPVAVFQQTESNQIREKDNKILELDTKIHQLEAIIIDLQDHLKEKDSVIDARTKAISLMSEDLSKKSKTTLDTLDETKDEMRSMQANFVLMETSLKNKNDHLLFQLEEKSNKIMELEEIINKIDNDHSITDTNMITDLKNEMSLMQENFILIESSLKDKIDNLMVQLVERETKLSEADEKILNLEKNNLPSDLTTNERTMEINEKLKLLEESNKFFANKNEELEKSLVELMTEKDTRISELENQLEENSKEKNESENVQKLTQELDELNKNMIKLKAQHKGKLKNLQKKLDDFKKISDVNAELVKLGNQVALLEEEKGNLQLSLVDFDELKASTAEMRNHVSELEEKLLAQTSDIQTHVYAIETLENQKFDLMQELHAVRQEVSALEAENADSENLRVTAELKVVDLEEQLDSLNKLYKNKNQVKLNPETVEAKEEEEEISDNKIMSIETSANKLMEKIEILMEKNRELETELKEIKEKSLNVDKKTSETDSTESFERMSDENSEIIQKMSVLEERDTEITENMTQSIHQRMENLVQENNDLVIELTKLQEKYDLIFGEKNSLKLKIDELNEKLLTENTSDNSIMIKLTNVELENIQLKDNLHKLLDKQILSSLESEISNCKKINDNQLELVKNIELHLENSEKEIVEKKEEIDACQFVIKNLTATENNYTAMEKLIENLKQEKLIIVEKMNKFDEENYKLISQLKTSEEDNKSSVQVFSDKIVALETKLIVKDSSIESRQSEIVLLQEDVEKNKKLIEELKEEVVELKQIIDKFENEKGEITAENKILKGQVEFKDESIMTLEEEFKTTVKIFEDQLRDKEIMMMSFDNQIPQLQESLEEKDQKIADLQDELNSLQEISGDNEKIFINYQNEIAELQESINEKEKMLNNLQEELEEKEKIINDLKEMLQDKENISVNLINKMELEIADLKSSLQENVQKNIKLENDEINAERVKYEEKIVSLEMELQEARHEINFKEESIRELKSVVDQREDTIENFKENNSMLNEKIQHIEAEMLEKHNHLVVNLETTERLNSEIENYEFKIKNNEHEIIKINEQVLQLNNVIDDYKNQVRILEDDVVSLTDKLRSKESYENKNEEMLHELEKNEQIIQDLKIKIDEKITENQELQAHIETINRELNQFQDILFEKETVISSLKAEKDNLLLEISKKAELENQMVHMEQLQGELNDAYRMMEQLKIKHTEDIKMMNDRTQEFIEELQIKTNELSDLELRLEEKEKLISQNMTEEVKKLFEAKIVFLENQLQETTTNMQNQLQKMKIIAANLKKKTNQCQQLEVKVTEYEEKWTIEKSEKEEMKLKIEKLETIIEQKSIDTEKLEQTILESEKSSDISRENIEKLGNELELTRDKIEFLMQESATLMSEIAKKHQEIEAKNTEIECLQSEKNSLIFEFTEFKEMAIKEKNEAEDKLALLEKDLNLSKEEIQSLNEEIKLLELNQQEIDNKKFTYMEEMTAEIEKKTAELMQRSLLIDEQCEINLQKSNEIERKSLEFQDKTFEINEKLQEIYDKSLEIEKKSSEIEEKEIEIQRRSLEIEEKAEEIAKKSAEIDSLTAEFSQFKENVTIEKRAMEISYEETSERARELGVRMQVMENEYVDQLNTIQKLKTENGMLMSKQTQINERLENTETELTEREKIIENLQNEISQINNPENQVTQTLVNMLESKLHERNAEIENLDNELATAISNFLQMRESLRTGEIITTGDQQQQETIRSVQEFNNLLARNSELEEQVRQMGEKIDLINSKNIENEDKISQMSEETQNIQKLYSELLEICKIHEVELEQIKKINNELELEKKKLIEKIEILEGQQRVSSEKQEYSTEPQLFDASKLFTSSSPWNLGNENEVSLLKKQLEEKQVMCNQLTEDITILREEIQKYKYEIQELSIKNSEITNEKIKLINIQDEEKIIKINYEENIKELLENLKILETKQSDYTSIINKFIIELKNKTQEEKLEMPVEFNTETLASKLNLILLIIDELKSQKNQFVAVKEEKIVKEEFKCEESVNLSTSQSAWNEEIKIDDDEEVWGWNQQEVELSTAPLTSICSSETKLTAKIAELEDTIKDFEDEKIKLNEDIKTSQIRCGKLVKKLKEFKIQNESLQKQIKLQLSSGGLGDLDTAIEEELKCQINKLEKILIELKNDNDKITLERDQLSKRIDVLMAGHERFTELKERQDREMEVLHIRNNELSTKLANYEREYPEISTTQFKIIDDPIVEKTEVMDNISKDEFDKLEHSFKILSMENEELKSLIEEKLLEVVEEKTQRHSVEEKLEEKIKESEEEKTQRLATVEKLNEKIREIDEEKNQRFILENKLMETVKEIEEAKKQTNEMKINYDEFLKNQQSISLEHNYEGRINQLENEIIEKSSRIDYLEGNLENSQTQLREIGESLENVTELLNVRVQEVADLKTKMQKFQVDRNNMETCQLNVEEIGKKLHENEEELIKKLADKDEEIISISSRLNHQLEEKLAQVSLMSSKIEELNLEREEIISKIDNQAQEIVFFKEKLDEKEWLLEKLNSEKSIDQQKILSYEEEINNSSVMINQLQNTITILEQTISEKSNELLMKEEQIEKLEKSILKLSSASVKVPICEDNIQDKSEITQLQAQLDTKLEEIEDWKYILNESTYPRILQELQDKVNLLYNEKLELEVTLASVQQQLQSQNNASPLEFTIEAQQSPDNLQEIEKIIKFKEEEINLLMKKLESKTIECSLLENALAKQLPDKSNVDGSQRKDKELTSSELDIALYMLHQRDVRCEELTHELMQLLEERDTLQLRLSNAIRLNEEMRRIIPADVEKSIVEKMPVVDVDPSTSSDSGEKVELAQKLSQLHNVGHRRDVRLMDDRELRNSQQMSLLAHKDALSTLPPDAAARLINANYTLSRDVQSPSSVLLNWLWGKSTPKVVHM